MTANDNSGDAAGPVKPWMLGVSSGLVVGSLIIYVLLAAFTPGFAELFAGFGADLPRLTQLALEKTHYALVPPLVGAGALMRLWLNRKNGSRMAISTMAVTGIAFGFSVAMVIAWFIAMYLPVFRMGSVVS